MSEGTHTYLHDTFIDKVAFVRTVDIFIRMSRFLKIMIVFLRVCGKIRMCDYRFFGSGSPGLAFLLFLERG